MLDPHLCPLADVHNSSSDIQREHSRPTVRKQVGVYISTRVEESSHAKKRKKHLELGD